MFIRQAEILATITMFLAIAILAMAAAIVVWQLLSGRINLFGLLRDKNSGAFSPGRLQLLIFTLVIGAGYLGAIVSTEENVLPDVPDWMISALGGSGALYMGGKSSPLLGRMVSSIANQNHQPKSK